MTIQDTIRENIIYNIMNEIMNSEENNIININDIDFDDIYEKVNDINADNLALYDNYTDEEIINELEPSYYNSGVDYSVPNDWDVSDYYEIMEYYKSILHYDACNSILNDVIEEIKELFQELKELMEEKGNTDYKCIIDTRSLYGWVSHTSEYEYKSLYIFDWSDNQIEGEFSGIETNIGDHVIAFSY